MRLDLAVVFVGAVLFTNVARIHLRQNKSVAKSTNNAYLYPRKTLGAAIESGILDPVKNEDVIFQNRLFPSDIYWFFATTAKRPLNVCDLTAAKRSLKNEDLKDPKIFRNCSLKYLYQIDPDLPNPRTSTVLSIDQQQLDRWAIAYSFDADQGKKGVVLLARVDEIVLDQGKYEILQLRIGSQLRIFEYQTKSMTEISLPAKSIDFLKVLELGLPASAKELNFSLYKSKSLFIKWYGKIHPFEGTNENNVRWSSGDAELVVYNLESKPIAVDLKATIATPGIKIEKSTLTISENSKIEIKTIDASPYQLDQKKVIKPGATSIKFFSDGKVISEDPRKIVFGIFNFSLAESIQ